MKSHDCLMLGLSLNFLVMGVLGAAFSIRRLIQQQNRSKP